jgi:hypothetical protein
MPNIPLTQPVGGHDVPDTLLPDQYFDSLVARASDMPEKRLMVAVLLDALLQLRRRGSVAASEAASWIRGDDGTADLTFSFQNICDALAIDADYFAGGLLRRTHMANVRRLPLRHLRSSPHRVTVARVRTRRRAVG